jgi:hypothetical protein
MPIYLGNPCGVVIKASGEPTVYHMGDTDIFSGMGLIAEIHAPDIAMVPIGDCFTMSPKTAALAVKRFFNLEKVIPCHYGSFPIIEPNADKFIAEMKGHAPPWSFRKKASRSARSPLLSEQNREQPGRPLTGRPQSQHFGLGPRKIKDCNTKDFKALSDFVETMVMPDSPAQTRVQASGRVRLQSGTAGSVPGNGNRPAYLRPPITPLATKRFQMNSTTIAPTVAPIKPVP